MDKLKSRVLVRIPEASNAESLVLELLVTIADRILLILGEDELPKRFQSIVVDAVVKAYRRIFYEGIGQENTGSIQTEFVENILSEYTEEFESFKAQKRKAEFAKKSKGGVRFL